MGLATTTLRIGLGSIMAGHGLQKLAGKFGGPGLDGAAAGFESMGFVPGKPYAAAAALSETIGGGLLATGTLTPLGAAMVTGTMAVAIKKVHAKNGLWVTQGGMEYNLVLMAGAFALTEVGPGRLALDGIITKRRQGFGWALVQLAAGVGGAAAVIALAQRNAGDGLNDRIDAAVAEHSDTISSAADAVSSVTDTVSSAANTVSTAANTASSAANTASSTTGPASPTTGPASPTPGSAAGAAASVPDTADSVAKEAAKPS
jgi:putative oxidoreductase